MKARMTSSIKSSAALLAVFLLTGLLAGCGQKGPLYPPDAENTAAEPIEAADEPADAVDGDTPAESAAEPTDAIEQAEAADR